MSECPECGDEITHDKPVPICAGCAWDHEPNVNTDPLYSIVLRGRFSPGDAKTIQNIAESLHDMSIIRAYPMKGSPSFYEQRTDALNDFYREYQETMPDWIRRALTAIIANGTYDYLMDELPEPED